MLQLDLELVEYCSVQCAVNSVECGVYIRACNCRPKLFFGKRLGSISMYFNILERIHFICVMRINEFEVFIFSDFFLRFSRRGQFCFILEPLLNNLQV